MIKEVIRSLNIFCEQNSSIYQRNNLITSNDAKLDLIMHVLMKNALDHDHPVLEII